MDGTLNSRRNPAPRGSVISVFGTGLGVTLPIVAAGTVTPSGPLSHTYHPVTASIGGVPCQVTFAGLAPGQVGQYQINILVDPAVSSGSREIVIANSGSSSQDSVFVEIR
jgi:uncharacterized protein (TIGR03437 family)